MSDLSEDSMRERVMHDHYDDANESSTEFAARFDLREIVEEMLCLTPNFKIE